MAEQPKQKFELRKVYVKDMSFESPMAPAIFRSGNTKPAVDVQLNVDHQELGDDMYESILTVTVNGKLNEKHAFLAEVQQAGVYEISGMARDKGLVVALEVACPNILFPFAREAISDLVTRGGFPQLLLSPVNFESLYRYKARSDANKTRNEDQSEGQSDHQSQDQAGENADEAAAKAGAGKAPS